MILNFSKDIVTNYAIDGVETANWGSLYKIFDGEIFKGQFLFNKKTSYVNYGNKKLIVDKKRKIINKDDVRAIIGEYKLSNWMIFVGYRDKLILGDQEYSFKKVKPDIPPSLFKKETWGQSKFELTAYDESITYSFKLKVPTISLGNPYIEKPFSGQIELSKLNIIAALLGLYLVERALYVQSLD